ncbi:galactose-3-O-sulfotransferase 2-like [Anneissia japonica]|uniref:galactose-3-O-sulfotransferase 2-like n=1 Tax=Anneissia japonica TaxID=1529436 RepID=UPI0014258D1B|nr:galactose-3-O-sulfotransferase 2-like [Anneissia japonica]XP_033113763.1 galactose-3-O-sulfotransferase 2-like [Anneissia japonica]
MHQKTTAILVTLLALSICLHVSFLSTSTCSPTAPFRSIYQKRTHNATHTLKFIDEVIHPASSVNPPQRTCSSEVVRNVAFIKTHKTASTTVSRIVERFGYLNNLSFVLNRNIPKNGHFYYISLNEILRKGYFLPQRGNWSTEYSNYRYNISTVHVLYNRTIFETFMDNRTKYITILRNPIDQFVSAFGYFSFKKVVKIANDSKALDIFMERPTFYRNRFGNSSALWRYSRNNQMFDLGLEHKFHTNVTLVKEKIKEIDEEFDFILIGDYLDESLLILRKMFCWSFEDIMYASQNRRKTKKESIGDDLQRKIRQWNGVDAMLYDHFNKTLWRKIAEYGNDFERDLEHLRNLNQQLIDNCTSGEVTKIHFRGFKQTKFLLAKNATDLCKLVIDTRSTLFRRIWDAQNILKPSRN